MAGMPYCERIDSTLSRSRSSLAHEAWQGRIAVNCIALGYTEADLTQGIEGEGLEVIQRRVPLGLPMVEDAAGAVSYLVSEDAARITVTVGGGSTAWFGNPWRPGGLEAICRAQT